MFQMQLKLGNAFLWFSSYRQILPSVLLCLVDTAVYSGDIQLENFIF